MAGVTFVEPFAEVEVKDPGVMAMDVAPLVVQLRVLLAPEAMGVGLAEKEVMVGALPALTVMVTFSVLEPEELVAVSV